MATNPNKKSKNAELEKLIRFLNHLGENTKPDREAEMAAINAIELRIEQLRTRRGPKSRKPPPIDSEEFLIALRYVQDQLKHDDAVKALKELVGKNQRTCEKVLAEMKPRAKRAVSFLQKLREAADKPK